jgi:hypothetical protein
VYIAFAYSVPLEAKADTLNHLDVSINEDFRKPFLKHKNATAGELAFL